MRALFLSYSLPPFADSQTIRNVFLLRGLAEAGFELDMVGPAVRGGDPSLADLLPPGDFHRAAPAAYDVLQAALGALPRRIRRFASAGLAIGAGKLCVPDVRSGWDRCAVRTVLRNVAGRIDLIVSASGSCTAHLAASRLARTLGVPWLADYGDPWSHNPLRPASHFHIRRWNEILERRALRLCSAITVTTEATRELFQNWLGRVCPPVEVVPCGYTAPSTPAPAARPGRPTILYAGTAGVGSRDIRQFMRSLDAAAARCFRTVAFELVGSVSPAFAAAGGRLPHLEIRSRAWVPYLESVRALSGADALLLIGNTTSLQIPGKVFNYLASGRPIIYIGQLPSAGDPTRRLIEGRPGVAILPEAESAMTANLETLLGRLDHLQAQSATRLEGDLLDYEWSRIGHRFASVALSTARQSGAGR